MKICGYDALQTQISCAIINIREDPGMKEQLDHPKKNNISAQNSFSTIFFPASCWFFELAVLGESQKKKAQWVCSISRIVSMKIATCHIIYHTWMIWDNDLSPNLISTRTRTTCSKRTRKQYKGHGDQ